MSDVKAVVEKPSQVTYQIYQPMAQEPRARWHDGQTQLQTAEQWLSAQSPEGLAALCAAVGRPVDTPGDPQGVVERPDSG